MQSDGLEKLPLAPELKARVRDWLTKPGYAGERPQLEQLVCAATGGDTEAVAELEDAFAGPLPIGTGGRRGAVGPGTNRINTAVIRETAEGVARALASSGEARRVAVVYDTRKDSRFFARVVSAQLAAAGLEVILIDAPRPTPLLSFLVRREHCGGGIVISASHNPPGDNGIKIYGADGAQVLGESDRRLMAAIQAAAAEFESVPSIDLDAVAEGRLPAKVRVVDPDRDPDFIDRPYQAYVGEQGVLRESLTDSGLKVVYSPLHGVGHHALVPVLRAKGVELVPVEAQCDPRWWAFLDRRECESREPGGAGDGLGARAE